MTKPLPVHGNVARLFTDPLTQLPKYLEMGDLYEVYNPVPGMPPVIMVQHPDLIRDVLCAKPSVWKKDIYTRKLADLLGNGLVTSEGDLWRRQRRLVHPGFQHKRIAGYADVMVECTHAMLDTWEERGERNIHGDMMKVTLDIVARTLFGTQVTSDADEIGEILETCMNWYLGIGGTGITLPKFIPTPANVRVKAAIRRTDEIIGRIIAERRASGEDHGDLLSMLVLARDEETGAGMDEKQLRDEAVTLLFAGHETTATALTMTLYLLSQHPRVEAKLHEEVDGLGVLTFDDLRRLPYTAAVVKESMRILPPVWGVGREAVDDLELGGFHVPKGTQAFLPQWSVHRDPRFYDDPEVFDPDRWTPEFEKSLHKFAFFPFGGGSRTCIGKRFAEMEATLVLATIAQRSALRLIPGETLSLLPSVTIRPKRGLRMMAEDRSVSQRQVA